MRTGAARDGAHGGVEIGRGQIGHLRLGDLFELLARHLADLLGVRTTRTRFDADRLLQKDRRRRRLRDEGEAAIRVDRDDRRNRQTRLELLRRGVERLAELHDVEAALTERGTHRRRRIGLTGLDLQLDVAGYFLCHCWFSCEFKRLHAVVGCGTPRCRLKRGSEIAGSGASQKAVALASDSSRSALPHSRPQAFST